MKTKHLLLLAVVFLVLLALVQGLEYFNRKETTSRVEEFVQADVEQLDRIEISYQEEFHRFGKQNNEWRLITPLDYKLNEINFNALLSKLEDFKTTNIISEAADKQEMFEVDQASGIRVSLYTGDLLVDDFFVGKISPDGNHTYVRQAESDQIKTARGTLRTIFNKTTNDWRDKTIWQIEPAETNRILVQRQGYEDFALAKNNEGMWQLENTEQEPDINKVQLFVNGLFYLTAFGFVDEEDLLSQLDFNDSVVQVTLTGQDGREQSLVMLEFDGKFYVQVVGSDQVFEVSRTVADNFQKQPADLVAEQELLDETLDFEMQ
ncbi:MAG TPA: DUF4340 domain-containing protein [Candidatus Wirthbacteria bacterium]|nr:DUF4340 domain-containing protein [Candidatus Wirthbacteria bacterium]